MNSARRATRSPGDFAFHTTARASTASAGIRARCMAGGAEKVDAAMNYQKPAPIYFVTPKGVKCPVCGMVSYSMGGIHPQCAVKQADAPRLARLVAEKREARLRLEKGV
jgi:hypothetical protein